MSEPEPLYIPLRATESPLFALYRLELVKLPIREQNGIQCKYERLESTQSFFTKSQEAAFFMMSQEVAFFDDVGMKEPFCYVEVNSTAFLMMSEPVRNKLFYHYTYSIHRQ